MDPAAGKSSAGLPAGGAAAAGARPAPWTTRASARVRWAGAAALFLLGCALAVIQHKGKTDDAEVADLRSGRFAAYLLLGVFAQVLAPIMLLMPAWQVAVSTTVVGILTAYVHGNDLSWLLVVVACHGSALGEPAFYFWVFYVVLWPVFAIGAFAVVCLCG